MKLTAKYLVVRRDGSIPKWPAFVLGARDPCALFALRAYARKAQIWASIRNTCNWSKIWLMTLQVSWK